VPLPGSQHRQAGSLPHVSSPAVVLGIKSRIFQFPTTLAPNAPYCFLATRCVLQRIVNGPAAAANARAAQRFPAAILQAARPNCQGKGGCLVKEQVPSELTGRVAGHEALRRRGWPSLAPHHAHRCALGVPPYAVS
jgi:hypothetical protein